MSIKSNVDKEKTIRILDYWFMMEFLDQKTLGEFKEKGDKAFEYKKGLKAGRKKNSKDELENFVQLMPEDTIQTVVESESEEMQLPIWSDFTVFVGCMKKENCIQKIAQNSGSKRQSLDENDDEIVLATVKFSSDGSYIPFPLSISPLVWAMKKMSGGTLGASQKLSIDGYNNDKRDIETKIRNLFNPSEDDTVESEETNLLTDLSTISYNQLKKVEDIICRELNIKEKDMDSWVLVLLLFLGGTFTGMLCIINEYKRINSSQSNRRGSLFAISTVCFFVLVFATEAWINASRIVIGIMAVCWLVFAIIHSIRIVNRKSDLSLPLDIVLCGLKMLLSTLIFAKTIGI